MKKSFIAKFLLSTMFIPTALAGSCKANPQPNNNTVAKPNTGKLVEMTAATLDLTSYNDWDCKNVLDLKKVYDDYIAFFEKHPEAIGILKLSGISLSRPSLFHHIKNVLEKIKRNRKSAEIY